MKSKLLLLLLLSFSLNLFSNELSGKKYFDWMFSIEFSESTFKVSGFDRYKDLDIDEEYNYKIVKHGTYSFIHFGDNFSKKWLALWNEEILLLFHNENSKPSWVNDIEIDIPFFGGSSKPVAGTRLVSICNSNEKITATSYLVEKDTHYSPNNLNKIGINKVWSEDAEGYGIGEKIFIPPANFNKLLFVNGYLSFNRPYLFYDNSRVKKIRVKIQNENVSFSKEFDIVDTIQPQILNFEKQVNGEITIEILEVYKGKKYKDTCISDIINFI